MKDKYIDLIEQTFDFPQDEFSVEDNELNLYDIPLMEIIKQYGTPLKVTYLPKISSQIARAKRMFNVAMAKVDYKGAYNYCYCTKSSHFSFVLEEALKNGGIDAAMEVARNTRGPIASIYYQGLDRYDQGLDAVEKAVVSYGSVQTGQMESGLSWIGLFIALSPMLGFMGTVVGMIAAFDAIQAAGDISPTLVAGGIKVALLTTLMGLIAAVVLQLFYNYIVSKIDSLVNDMEDSSITLMDILTAYNKK